jgi:hypothetical protein
MACPPYATQVNLRFGNPTRQLIEIGAGSWSGNFAPERLNFLRQSGIRKNGQA